MTQIKTKIPAELEPAAVGGMVADAKYIIDRVKNKNQTEVNAETDASINQLSNEIDAVNTQDIVPVDSLPAVGNADPRKIYRVVGETSYTDNMVNAAGDGWKELAVYTFPGIDDEPTAGSDNLVKSGGIVNFVNLSRADNYREKETISFTKTDGKYFKVDGTEVSNAGWCIVKVDFPNPYYDEYYIDNIYVYGTANTNIGYIRYKDANNNVIKTIANSVRSGFIGYRVEKIEGASSFEICGPKDYFGTNGFNVYKGGVSIIPDTLSTIENNIIKLDTQRVYSPAEMNYLDSELTEVTPSETITGKYIKADGTFVDNASFRIYKYIISSLGLNIASNNFVLQSLFQNAAIFAGVAYFDSNDTLIRCDNFGGAYRRARINAPYNCSYFLINVNNDANTPTKVFKVTNPAAIKTIEQIIENENFNNPTSFVGGNNIEKGETLSPTIENGKYFKTDGTEVSMAGWSILSLNFPNPYLNDYYVSTNVNGSTVGFIRYKDSNNNVIKTTSFPLRGGAVNFPVKKIDGAVSFSICGVTDLIASGKVGIFQGILKDISSAAPLKYEGKKMIAIGDSHTVNRSKWLPYVLEHTGAIGNETVQNIIQANAGYAFDPKYPDALLNAGAVLLDYKNNNGYVPDIILIEQCHYFFDEGGVNMPVILPESYTLHPTVFNSKSEAEAYWDANKASIISGITPAPRHLYKMQYGTIEKNLVFTTTKTLTAGNVSLTIDGTTFVTQIEAGMTLQDAVHAMSIWKYGDTTDWRNEDEINSNTLHLYYKGTSASPELSVSFVDTDNTGLALSSIETDYDTTKNFVLRYYYPSATDSTSWNNTDNWMSIGLLEPSYGWVKGFFEFMQKNFPTTQMIVWSVTGYAFSLSTYTVNGVFDYNRFLAEDNTYKTMYETATKIMFDCAERYNIPTIDVQKLCGITPFNLLEFMNENDLHPKPAGYQRWAETLVRYM